MHTGTWWFANKAGSYFKWNWYHTCLKASLKFLAFLFSLIFSNINGRFSSFYFGTTMIYGIFWYRKLSLFFSRNWKINQCVDFRHGFFPIKMLFQFLAQLEQFFAWFFNDFYDDFLMIFLTIFSSLFRDTMILSVTAMIFEWLFRPFFDDFWWLFGDFVLITFWWFCWPFFDDFLTIVNN